ncbi:MAG: hypothetical protein WC560_02825 [Syntrophales bacterium]
MKKVLVVIFSLLLFVTLSFVVTGCKKQEESTPEVVTEEPAPAAPAVEAAPAMPAAPADQAAPAEQAPAPAPAQ